MTLDEEHRRGATWAVLKKYLNERIDALRRENDGELDPVKTARLRGRIAEAKAILALGEPKPKALPEPDIE